MPLSAAGRQQAKQLSTILAAVALDRILSSPAARARETAQIIAARQHQRPQVAIDERLREVDFGPFEGHSATELVVGPLAEQFARWRNERSPTFPQGAETYGEASERAAAVFEELTQSNGTTLLVGHGYLSRLMLARCVLDLPLASVRRLRFDTGRLAVVAWEENLARLISFNTDGLAGLR